MSWKLHFQLLRDAWVKPDGSEFDKTNPTDVAALEACVSTEPGSGGECRRRFDPNRNLLFRYLLFSHARGMPREPFPCLPPGAPSPLPDPLVDDVLLQSLIDASTLDEDGACTAPAIPNPEFHAPQRVSGVADLPGLNAMVSLGLSNDFLGTEFFQASTTLHEFGHLFDLWHGGDRPQYGPIMPAGTPVFVQPNCKPNYQSSMSYLHQLAGLVDNFGVPHIDYSGVTTGLQNGGIDETGLFDGFLNNPESALYRAAWYAPIEPGGSLDGIIPVATKHCDGSPLLVDLGGPAEPPMGRLEAAIVSDPIDWAADGAVAAPQDVNFDGKLDGLFAVSPAVAVPLQGFNDVLDLRVNQAGGGQSATALSTGIAYIGGRLPLTAFPTRAASRTPLAFPLRVSVTSAAFLTRAAFATWVAIGTRAAFGTPEASAT